MLTYYLSSLDSYALESVRTCEILAFIQFDTGKPCAVASVHPPIQGQQFGLSQDVRMVVLSTRHEGDDIRSISDFPCFVHVTRPLVTDIRDRSTVTAQDLENLAWGELYRTKSDAENHVFD